MADTTTNERKVTNLDELIPDDQFVVLDNKEHRIVPASVEMYLTVMKRRQRMKNADTDIEQMEQAIELITMACPTIDRERLGRLPLRALTKLTDIIQEQMSDEAEGDDKKNAPEPNTESGE